MVVIEGGGNVPSMEKEKERHREMRAMVSVVANEYGDDGGSGVAMRRREGVKRGRRREKWGRKNELTFKF